MTTQPTLFGYPTTHAVQPELFDPANLGWADLACKTCGRFLMFTESGYLCCPAGHGKLIPTGEETRD